MRGTWNPRWLLAFVIGLILSAGGCPDPVPECTVDKYVCTAYLSWPGCAPRCLEMEWVGELPVCAQTRDDAWNQAQNTWTKMGYVVHPLAFDPDTPDPQNGPRHCVQTSNPMVVPQTAPPPACAADPADNPCDTCAKSACCDAYAACIGDASCLCWVDCSAAGNPVSVCAEAVNCGAPDGVTTAAAACLGGACSGACVPMMGSPPTCSCDPGVGGGPGIGGSFGDGVGGSSDIGGVGPVGSSSGSFTSSDAVAVGVGGFGALHGRGGAGGAW
jgi:hypothetical protein